MVYLFIFIIGACLGSFYLVIGKRLPKEENVVNSRSMCDSCHHILSWWQLIPVISYLILLGKCHYCKKRISPLNIIVEISMGILFVIGYIIFGLGYDYYIFLIVSSLMMIIFISDFTYFIINDSPLVIAALIVSFLKIYFYGFKEFGISVLCGIALFATMYLIKLFGDFVFKRESLGGGDIKFAFIMGFILNFKFGLCALILSTFLALPYSMASILLKKNNEVPFGPFLSASLFITFLFLDKFTSLLDLIFISL